MLGKLKGIDIRCARTTCMTSPSTVYSFIFSTASLKDCSPVSDVKSDSRIVPDEGFEFCLIFLLLSEFALSVSSFFVSIMELSISGSTNLIYWILLSTLSKTTISSLTISRMSGVPMGSGGVDSLILFSTYLTAS